MSFDWSEYLDLARFLVGQENGPTQEAAYRCAVSRAYYAAFCHARNYARDRHGFEPTRTGEDHWLVRRHFQRKRMFSVVDKLRDLNKWRSDCDYEDTVPKIAFVCMSAIKEAQEILDTLK